MSEETDWEVPANLRPMAADFPFDVARALSAVVAVRSETPEEAFTASVLGTERDGHGVLIDDSGLVLTIGYLILEAETIWLTATGGQVMQAHVVGYDQESGFGLVQALGRLNAPALALGRSADVHAGARVIVAGFGGERRALAAWVAAKREFAGYWEYLLDEAFFTAPAYPNWGGAAMIGREGTLLGIGSLRIEQAEDGAPPGNFNMIVPIDLLKPIKNDLLRFGATQKPPRPWLGVYTVEHQGSLIVVGMPERGPAGKAGIKVGDVIKTVNGAPVADLAELYRRLWGCGAAGVGIALGLVRDGNERTIEVRTANRSDYLRSPRMH